MGTALHAPNRTRAASSGRRLARRLERRTAQSLMLGGNAYSSRSLKVPTTPDVTCHPRLRSRLRRCAIGCAPKVRFAVDLPLEEDGFELPVPHVLEPSQFIRLLDTAFAFCRRDRRRIGDRRHLPQAERIGWAPDRCRLHTIQIWSRSLFTHLLGRAMWAGYSPLP